MWKCGRHVRVRLQSRDDIVSTWPSGCYRVEDDINKQRLEWAITRDCDLLQPSQPLCVHFPSFNYLQKRKLEEFRKAAYLICIPIYLYFRSTQSGVTLSLLLPLLQERVPAVRIRTCNILAAFHSWTRGSTISWWKKKSGTNTYALLFFFFLSQVII